MGILVLPELLGVEDWGCRGSDQAVNAPLPRLDIMTTRPRAPHPPPATIATTWPLYERSFFFIILFFTFVGVFWCSY